MEQAFGGDEDWVESQGEQADKKFNDGVSSEGGGWLPDFSLRWAQRLSPNRPKISKEPGFGHKLRAQELIWGSGSRSIHKSTR